MALRTGQKIVFAGAGLAVVVAAVGGWMGLNMKRLLTESPVPVVSPDGSTRVRLTVNMDRQDPATHLAYVVHIESADGGREYYAEQTPYSTRLKWTLAWTGNDRVEFRGLQGTRVYRVNDSGKWARIDSPDALPATAPAEGKAHP